MNMILNVSAFLRVARLGSFSGAAREMKAVTSVVIKRISQLENEVGTKLLIRSTRGLALTAAGERYIPQFVRLVAAYDEVFKGEGTPSHRVEGFVRIITPPTITSMFLGTMFTNFQLRNPRVDMEVIMMERSINPLEEGFDLALGAWPISYPNVIDVPLCRYELATVCAPSYLKGKEKPTHPTELVDHQCLTTSLFRTTWAFTHARGSMTVEVHSRMQSSDSRMVRDAARMGMGITILPRMLVDEDLRAGTLVTLLEDFPVAAYWVKMLVPRMKINRPVVHALVAFLKENMQAIQPVQT
ncbi:MAG: Bacterial regulatory helix-turn-helix protein LysR family protein [Gammaproteobacteria bacterium]|nr:Bacterial regulatory helix-turn-helix protein LysR family protein [Gammaproteobacteria bacterium]